MSCLGFSYNGDQSIFYYDQIYCDLLFNYQVNILSRPKNHDGYDGPNKNK